LAFPNMILSQQLIEERDLWVVEFAPLAVDALQVLSRQDAGLLIGYLDRQLHGMPNPRSIGKKLFCEYGYLWRYRVGNYRLVAQLDHKRRAIVVLLIEKRFCDLMTALEEAERKEHEAYEAEWNLIEEKKAKLATEQQDTAYKRTELSDTEPKKERLDEAESQRRLRLMEATLQRKAVKSNRCPTFNIFH